jgi:hypothetical protein
MPDPGAIAGGEETPDWEHEIARQHFEHFALALLRSLASGERIYELVEDFFAFFKHAKETGIPIRPVFDEAVMALRERTFAVERASPLEEARIAIVQAALRFIAEKASTDTLANARRSNRRYQLDQAIAGMIVEAETRARSNGRSYVDDLTKHLGERPPTRARRARPGRHAGQAEDVAPKPKARAKR